MRTRVIVAALAAFSFVFLAGNSSTPSAFAAENSALKAEISSSLNGTVLVSKVTFGGRAIATGYQTDWPVITIVNAETGAVTYRVESGIVRFDVGQREMRRHFAPGSRFHVSGIDLKDDRLELMLEGGNGISAKVRLVLGQGWQSSMNADAVVHSLQKVLASGQQPQDTDTQTGNVRTPVISPPARSDISAEDVGLIVINAVSARPIENAEIQLCQPGCQTVTRTNQEGKAVLKSIPDGTVSLAVVKEGFQSFTATPNVATNQRLFSIKLEEKHEPKPCNSATTPEERQQWAAQHGNNNMYMSCKQKTYGVENKSLTIVCDAQGFALMGTILKETAKELCAAGFKHVHLSDGQWAEWDYVTTSEGIKPATLENIPIDATPDGRGEFAEMMFAQYFNRGCRWATIGNEGTVLYFGCPEMTWEKVKETYSNVAVAKNFRARGFASVVYSDAGNNNWVAGLSDSGFLLTGAITADALLEKYGFKNQLIVAREEAEVQKYHDYLYALTGSLIKYAEVKREKAKRAFTATELAEYRLTLSEENTFVANLKINAYAQRPTFWPDLRQYSALLLGGGVHEGFAEFRYSSASPEYDAIMKIELSREVDYIESRVAKTN
jgi:hypothetical protein